MPGELAIVEKQLGQLAPHFNQALAGVIPVERLIRTVMVSVERNPKLLQCERQSLFNSAMSAAVLGLEVDGVTGQAFLIPFKNKAQLVIGYKGLNTLAARAGITITGEVVREGDVFEYDIGEGWVSHKPVLGNQARIVAAWAKAAHNDRPPVICVMGIAEILEVKGRSSAVKSGHDTPWNDPRIGFPAMAVKTVKRRLARSVPMANLHYAARLDEAVDEQDKTAWVSPEKGVIVEGEIVEPSPTPTMQELTAPQTSGPRVTAETAPAATEVAPQPQAPAAGAIPPDWQEYALIWDGIMEQTTTSGALRDLWNSERHRAIRDALKPTDQEVDTLMSKVKSRREQLVEAATRNAQLEEQS